MEGHGKAKIEKKLMQVMRIVQDMQTACKTQTMRTGVLRLHIMDRAVHHHHITAYGMRTET